MYSVVELHFTGLMVVASNLDKKKFRMMAFFFENRPPRQFAVRLLLFTAFTCV